MSYRFAKVFGGSWDEYIEQLKPYHKDLAKIKLVSVSTSQTNNVRESDAIVEIKLVDKDDKLIEGFTVTGDSKARVIFNIILRSKRKKD